MTTQRVVVVLEQRFLRSSDGAVWTSMAFDSEFWERYLMRFRGVDVVARTQHITEPPTGAVRADQQQVSFLDVPFFVGPMGFAKNAGLVKSAIERAVGGPQPVLLRVPGTLGTLAARSLLRRGKPFGVEVVGDPLEVFARGTVRHPLRVAFQKLFWSELRLQCKRASVVAYVTESALQHRYPAGPGAFVTHYSSIQLDDEAFATPRTARPSRATRLITVGSLEQNYKGVDVLIEALAHCRHRGLDLSLDVVGDGAQRDSLEELAQELGLEHVIRFRGLLAPGEPVRAALRSADAFVLASRTEGLPRAMIEAMAAGLPCVGTRVGGIPELLDDEFMVAPGSSLQLADLLCRVLVNNAAMQEMSARNVLKAREFGNATLNVRRFAAYEALAERTAVWLQERAGRCK